MKKIISVFIILALSFSMFSCKRKADTGDEIANTVQDDIPATETKKKTESEPEKETEDTDDTENKPSQPVNSETKTPEPEQVTHPL